ncbi:hypothetical protein BVC80_9033g62 [Macleaya cordata]|uniref:LOB domain-containing protein n=1 Tax=Macleaya cordata TaxID=56857 RepID=A0A200QYP2_MACCD|nr:hypothetical protein BVC80_9033g62 [Macleaya cordata]
MGGHGSSCGACKFLRRKCNNGCVFAPYFCYDQAAAHFAAVHKVFGASNVSKLLSNVPVHNRSEAAVSISYEALARMHNPTYGCVAQIFALQQQVAILQEEIEQLETQGGPHRATHDVINRPSSQSMNDNSTLFRFSSSQLNDLNLHDYCNQQVHDPSNVMMNLNGNIMALNKDTNLEIPEQHIWGNHLFSEDYTNEINSLEMRQLPIIGTTEQEIYPWLDDAAGMQSSTQLINPSLLDDLLGEIDQ